MPQKTNRSKSWAEAIGKFNENADEDDFQSIVWPRGTKLVAKTVDTNKKSSVTVPNRLVIISDIHFGVQDDLALEAFHQFNEDIRPDTVVVAGDAYDFWSISRFEKEPKKWRQYGAYLTEEFKIGEEFWERVNSYAKNILFLKGNHENRWERLVAANPGLSDLIDWHHVGRIPANVQIIEYGTRLKVGSIWIEHGDRIPAGVKNRAEWLLNNRPGQNSVAGHWHLSETKRRNAPTETGNKRYFAHILGHMSDLQKQTYTGGVANWTQSFLFLEFYKVRNNLLFTDHPIDVLSGRFVFGGKLYDGRRKL